jgi:hypothetical protein
MQTVSLKQSVAHNPRGAKWRRAASVVLKPSALMKLAGNSFSWFATSENRASTMFQR